MVIIISLLWPKTLYVVVRLVSLCAFNFGNNCVIIHNIVYPSKTFYTLQSFVFNIRTRRTSSQARTALVTFFTYRHWSLVYTLTHSPQLFLGQALHVVIDKLDNYNTNTLIFSTAGINEPTRRKPVEIVTLSRQPLILLVLIISVRIEFETRSWSSIGRKLETFSIDHRTPWQCSTNRTNVVSDFIPEDCKLLWALVALSFDSEHVRCEQIHQNTVHTPLKYWLHFIWNYYCSRT